MRTGTSWGAFFTLGARRQKVEKRQLKVTQKKGGRSVMTSVLGTIRIFKGGTQFAEKWKRLPRKVGTRKVARRKGKESGVRTEF